MSKRHRLGQPVVQQQPVGQIRQAVVLGQVTHSQGRCTGRAHVMEDDDPPGDLTLAVMDGRGRIFNGGFCSVSADQDAIGCEADGLVFPDGECHGIARFGARSAVDDSEHFFKGVTHGLGLRPSGQGFSDDIEIGHIPCNVGTDYRIADGVEGDLGAFVLLEHCLRVRGALDHAGNRFRP